MFSIFPFGCIARVANCVPSRIDLQVGRDHVNELACDRWRKRWFDCCSRGRRPQMGDLAPRHWMATVSACGHSVACRFFCCLLKLVS